MTDRILILDFGSQFTQLIARRVRESGVYSEIRPFNISNKEITEFKPKAIILSGGPASVHEAVAPKVSHIVFELGVPVLGICYGQQLMCQQLGGKVEMSDHREFGRAMIDVCETSPLLKGVWNKGDSKQVWMSHGDRVTQLPEGFSIIAKTVGAPFAAIADEKRAFYGVQFHPEVVHTPDGGRLLHNFTHAIAGCKGDWTMAAFRENAIARVRQQVGKHKVLCGVSGGVDSSVVAALLHEAIGDQLTCIFIDNGLLRSNESAQVNELFRTHFKIPLVTVDASELFLSRLSGVNDPERKRKIIGETFIEVFEQEAHKTDALTDDSGFLAQGTLYPDVIESVSFIGGPSVTIKSHHNVGGLPERMKMKLVEPLRELFKDEVRALGRELGMPADMVGRHPFPGPGLAIRVPGDITVEKLDLLRKADTIYIEEIRKSGLYNTIWQAFAVLLPVRTVGVMGDSRSYDYVCALRAVTSTDGMTADYYHFSHDFLSHVCARIINEVKGINRIVYDITSKPPERLSGNNIMNELIREIEEDIRQERLDRLWQSLGKFLVGVSMLVVLATIVFEVMQHRRQTAAVEMTTSFLKGVDKMNMQDYKGAITAFSSVTNDTSSPYYGLCMLEKAQAQTALSDTAAAAKTYDDLASKDPVFGKLAEVLKSSQNDPKTVNNTPLSAEPFYFTRGEWRGWQLWQQGKKDEAISQFLALYNDPNIPHTMRNRLSEVLHHIAPDKLPVEPLELQGNDHE